MTKTNRGCGTLCSCFSQMKLTERGPYFIRYRKAHCNRVMHIKCDLCTRIYMGLGCKGKTCLDFSLVQMTVGHMFIDLFWYFLSKNKTCSPNVWQSRLFRDSDLVCPWNGEKQLWTKGQKYRVKTNILYQEMLQLWLFDCVRLYQLCLEVMNTKSDSATQIQQTSRLTSETIPFTISM